MTRKLEEKAKNWQSEFNIADLLYADDTLLIATTDEAMNVLLAAIETGPYYYNMKLNKAKCLTLTMNGTAHTNSKNGTTMRHAAQATYLGIALDENHQTNPSLGPDSLTHLQPSPH